ncbi:6-bladed beta-propeller, partial [candidate division KSB1 bacterium]
MNKYIVKALCAIVVIYVNCGERAAYTVEEIDGVRHIYNSRPLWGNEKKFEFEFIKRIGIPATGQDEDEDDNYVLFQIAEIEIDEYGNYYVVEAGNKRIQKFDPDGTYLMTIGREGKGPGEFEYPNLIEIDSDNNIYVSEQVNHWLHIFSPEGKFIKRIAYEFYLTTFNMHLLRSGNIITKNYNPLSQYLNFAMPDSMKNDYLYELRNKEMEILLRFG